MKAVALRRYAIGAEAGEAGTQFRVWAPDRQSIRVVEAPIAGREFALTPEEGGYFSGLVHELKAGDLYGFRVDGSRDLFPDPASRFQPQGPHGPSQIVDASRFQWHDGDFQIAEDARVIYELHVGTFTPEGTFAAAAQHLSELADLGITVIELMPLNDFSGQFGWGYDGVNLWAPTRLYGSPDDLRSFISTAHDLGLAVILDVVYNHFGPDGNYLAQFSRSYVTDAHDCDWGEAINFNGPGSGPVREFFRENARYWVTEFHFDGLRIDATQALHDDSERHIIQELVGAARAGGDALGKRIYLVAENEPQHARIVRPTARGGYGVDALWNDDFHHTAMVTLTGRHPAYYTDYRGTPQELISALRWGYLYQGQHYYWQKHRRGRAALDLNADNFVTYLQNHDQIANSVTGERVDRATSPAELRAMTALMLLSPPTPMLFQGQEFGATTPFFYFADHEPKIASVADRERRKFLAQFPATRSAAAEERIPHPAARDTFQRCKLDWSERDKNTAVVQLHRDLLHLRKHDPVLRQRRADLVHGAVLTDRALALRFMSDAGDRLLIVNFGGDIELHPAPEPLLAPPDEQIWDLLWCSEDLRYGGQGYTPPTTDGKFELSARSALLFAAAPAGPDV